MDTKERYRKVRSRMITSRGFLEQIERTTDALVLGFTKPLAHDLRIPPLYDLHFSIGYAIENSISDDHVSTPEFKDKCGRANFNLTLEDFLDADGWSRRTTDSLFSLLYITFSLGGCGNEPDYPLISRILDNDHRFRTEWAYGKGECMDYREGKRNEAEKLVKLYFQSNELKNLQGLHADMQKYVAARNKI